MSDLNAVAAIIRDVLNQPDLEIGPNDGAETVEKWDSLATVNILSAVTQEFSISPDMDDFPKFATVSGILEVLKRNKA